MGTLEAEDGASKQELPLTAPEAIWLQSGFLLLHEGRKMKSWKACNLLGVLLLTLNRPPRLSSFFTVMTWLVGKSTPFLRSPLLTKCLPVTCTLTPSFL